MFKYQITYRCDPPNQCDCTAEIESQTIQGIIEKIERIEENNHVYRIQKIIEASYLEQR